MAHRKRLADRDVFTTGDIARLCNVTIRTVIRWFESGALPGYKIPGSKTRRVPREQLIAFLRAHGMPLGELAAPGGAAAGARRILVVDDEPAIAEMLRALLKSRGFVVEVALNGYEAGTRTVTFAPHLIVLDYNLGDSTGLDVARTVRSNEALASTKILCMSGMLEGDAVREVLAHGVDDFVRKPLDLADVVARVDRLLAAP